MKLFFPCTCLMLWSPVSIFHGMWFLPMFIYLFYIYNRHLTFSLGMACCMYNVDFSVNVVNWKNQGFIEVIKYKNNDRSILLSHWIFSICIGKSLFAHFVMAALWNITIQFKWTCIFFSSSELIVSLLFDLIVWNFKNFLLVQIYHWWHLFQKH
jgi:hypothetical protein